MPAVEGTMPPRITLALACIICTTAAQSQSTGVWTQLVPATSPPPYAYSDNAMLYDPVRDRMVFTAGYDTWEFDGTNWQRLPQPLSVQGLGRLWWDNQQSQVMQLQDFHIPPPPGPATVMRWDGTTWVPTSTVPGAPERMDQGTWVFDSLRNVAVWFLGNNNRSDTYEWDGLSYHLVSSTGPAPRTDQAMVFDAGRGQVLLFGGTGPFGARNDTWTWDGVAWTQHAPSAVPPGRTSAIAAYSGTSNRVVLCGGQGTSFTLLTDTWEWDGTNWTQVTVNVAPPSRSLGCMAFDSHRNRMVSFGGLGYLRNPTNETWVLERVGNVQASFTQFGQGCLGPVGTPMLSAVAGSSPRIGQSLQVVLSNMPASPFNFPFLAAGFDNQTWNGSPLPVPLDSLGMPGCSVWIRPDLSFTLTNVGGTASWSLSIPYVLSFVGANIYVQGAVLVPGFNPGSVTVSNAAHIVVGTN
jgi:hypothetical protein